MRSRVLADDVLFSTVFGKKCLEQAKQEIPGSTPQKARERLMVWKFFQHIASKEYSVKMGNARPIPPKWGMRCYQPGTDGLLQRMICVGTGYDNKDDKRVSIVVNLCGGLKETILEANAWIKEFSLHVSKCPVIKRIITKGNIVTKFSSLFIRARACDAWIVHRKLYYTWLITTQL
jgi:hypothetical protein